LRREKGAEQEVSSVMSWNTVQIKLRVQKVTSLTWRLLSLTSRLDLN